VPDESSPNPHEFVKVEPSKFIKRINQLPLSDYFDAAHAYALERWKDRNGETFYNGKVRTPLFELIYLMRGHRDLASLTALEAWNALQTVAGEKWFIDFGSKIREALEEFRKIWDSFEHIPGTSMLKQAMDEADLSNIPEDVWSSGYYRFLAVVKKLQELKGDQDFIVDIRASEWGDDPEWGVNHMTVWRYVCRAKDDGYLEEKFKGSWKSRKASEYRFIDQAPVLAAA
jgi:hypothetical protein